MGTVNDDSFFDDAHCPTSSDPQFDFKGCGTRANTLANQFRAFIEPKQRDPVNGLLRFPTGCTTVDTTTAFPPPGIQPNVVDSNCAGNGIVFSPAPPNRRQDNIFDTPGTRPKSISKGLSIVVDNGSSDNTAREAECCGATVKYEPTKGYGAACQTGIKALTPDIDIVIFLDADYSDHPEDIETLLSPIAEDRADLVLGSRTLRGDARRALSWQQHWGNRLATKLIGWRFGYEFTDLGPFRAIRRGALEAFCMRDRGYGWTTEMQVKAALAGLRVMEVPVRYRPRVGHSKISGTLKGSVCSGAKILWTIGRYSLASQSYCPTFARRRPA